MHQTRRELLDELLDFVGELGDANARNTAERLLNRAINTLWLRMPWRQFVDPVPYTFSTVGGTRNYALPAYFGRVSNNDGKLRNASLGSPLYPIEREDAEQLFPAAGTALEVAGRSDRYALGGEMPVHTQPATAGEALEVVSDSTSDVNVKVTIAGLNSAGVYFATQVTLNGTTEVAAGTWARIDEFSKAIPAGSNPATEYFSSVGSVTLRKASDATALQTLLPYESLRLVPVLTLYPKPNAVWTISVPVLRRPRRLVYDGDPVPTDWGPALFEQMLIGWRVNTGEIAHDSNVAEPRYIDLVCHENASRPQRKARPFHI